TLVELQDEGDRALHVLARDFLAIDLQHARSAASDAADTAEFERADPEPVIFEVELHFVPAGREPRAFPAHTLEIGEVPQEHRLALGEIEAVAAEASALRDQHAAAAALRDLDVRFEAVRGVQDGRRVAVRRARHRHRPNEFVAPRRDARLRRDGAGYERV